MHRIRFISFIVKIHSANNDEIVINKNLSAASVFSWPPFFMAWINDLPNEIRVKGEVTVS